MRALPQRTTLRSLLQHCYTPARADPDDSPDVSERCAARTHRNQNTLKPLNLLAEPKPSLHIPLGYRDPSLSDCLPSLPCNATLQRWRQCLYESRHRLLGNLLFCTESFTSISVSQHINAFLGNSRYENSGAVCYRPRELLSMNFT